jgi:hypothetical protein
MVLAIIVSTSLAVMSRCLEATVNLRTRMAAFSLARENMENLLGATAVTESVDYGDSNDVAGVTWETRIEPFYDPHTTRMWIRAISAASWYDTNGELQTIEFTQWLTDLNEQDVGKILRRQQAQQENLDEQTLAQVQELYQKAVEARAVAGTSGYDDMVALCRQLIQDYPSTTSANSARSLLREMPPEQKQAFDVKPYETTPVISPVNTGSDTSSPQAPDSSGATADTSDQEKVGGYTWDQLDQIYAQNPDRFWRIVMENMFKKK